MQIVSKAHVISIQERRWLTPTTITQCSVCQVDAGSVTICKLGHRICSQCFDNNYEKFTHCPECRNKKGSKDLAGFTVAGGKRILQDSSFGCTAKGCTWSGSYDQLGDHIKSCTDNKVNCPYKCDKQFTPREFDEHKKNCSKRPHKEGNFEATFETIQAAKKLKLDCQTASSQPPPLQEANDELHSRLLAIFPQVLNAALKEPNPESPPFISCVYGCGQGVENEPEKINLHQSLCPNVPSPCTLCELPVKKVDITDHLKDCPKCPVSCRYCDINMQRSELDSHWKYECDRFPAKCFACHAEVIRSELDKHENYECLQNPMSCTRCLESTTVSHRRSCRFIQKLILPASTNNAAVTLHPQPGSSGSVYQPECDISDAFSIYLALPAQKFKRYLNFRNLNSIQDTYDHPLFESKNRIKCTYAREDFYINPKYYSYHKSWSLSVRYIGDSRSNKLWTSVDILDTQNQQIAYLELESQQKNSDAKKICIKCNGNSDSMFLKKEQAQKVLVIAQKP